MISSKAAASADAALLKQLLEHQGQLEGFISRWTAQQRQLLAAASAKTPSEAGSRTASTEVSLEPPVSLERVSAEDYTFFSSRAPAISEARLTNHFETEKIASQKRVSIEHIDDDDDEIEAAVAVAARLTSSQSAHSTSSMIVNAPCEPPPCNEPPSPGSIAGSPKDSGRNAPSSLLPPSRRTGSRALSKQNTEGDILRASDATGVSAAASNRPIGSVSSMKTVKGAHQLEDGVESEASSHEEEKEGIKIELHESWDNKAKGSESKKKSKKESRTSNAFGFDVFDKADFAAAGARANQKKKKTGIFVISPSSTTSATLSGLGMLLLLYDLVSIPLLVFEPADTPFTLALENVSLLFWSMDMVVSAMKGYINHEGELEMRTHKAIIHYFRTHFILDAVLLAIEWINFLLRESEGDLATSARFIRMSRYARLLKVGKMQRLSLRFQGIAGSNVLYIASNMMQCVALMLVGIHLIACGFWGTGYYRDPNLSWIAVYQLETLPYRYLICVLWSLSLFGFGNSQIRPQNDVERVYAIFTGVICVVALCLLVGTVVTGMTRIQSLDGARRAKEQQLRDYLKTHKVTWNLRNRIWNFLRKKAKQSGTAGDQLALQDVDLLANMPKVVIQELKSEVFIPVLTVHPFFKTYAVSQADKGAMYLLVERGAVKEKFLDSEHELFRSGELGTCMFFVFQGKLEYQSEKRPAATLKAPSIHPGASGRRTMQSFRQEMSPLLGAGHWLSEGTLWLKWTHFGVATAKSSCELTVLQSQVFQAILREELIEAAIYARAFLAYAVLNEQAFDDYFFDAEALTTMARATFEPPLVFDVSRCRPTKNDYSHRDEWNPKTLKHWQRVWISPWKENHVLDRSALITTMTTDMKNDAVLMYQTIFAQNSPDFTGCKWLSDDDVLQHDRRILFLKRLHLCFAICHVGFTSEDNGAITRPWPFPLASVLCHGGRVLFVLNGIPHQDFLNFLMFGSVEGWDWNARGVPPPFASRRAATHGMEWDSTTSQLRELKLNHASAVIQRGHLGMDLPIGGIGNPLPPNKQGQLFIGPSGVPFKAKRRQKGTLKQFFGGDSEIPTLIKEIQHGHMYIRGSELGMADIMMPEENMPSLPVSMQSEESSHALGRLARGSLVGNGDWHTVTDLKSAEELRALLLDNDYTPDADVIDQLWQYIEQRELVVETKEDGDDNHRISMRFHGVLLHLEVEYVPPGNGETLVLCQTSAAAFPDSENSNAAQYSVGIQAVQGSTHSKSFRGTTQGRRASQSERLSADSSVCIEDRSILSILCCHHEPWANAVMRYCKEVFLMGDDGAKEIVKGCQKGKDTCIYESGYAPTICHHHSACCGDDVPLEYNTLHLRIVISDPESPLFAPLMVPDLETRETAFLHGFGSIEYMHGTILRRWKWMKKRETIEQGVTGALQHKNKISLNWEEQRVDGLLIGIECSAPLKDDIFGNAHSVDGKSKDMSAFGKRKWRDYRRGDEEVPSSLGGVQVTVNSSKLVYLQLVCEALNLCKPSDGALTDKLGEEQELERQLFQALFQAPDAEWENILRDFLGRKSVDLPATPDSFV